MIQREDEEEDEEQEAKERKTSVCWDEPKIMENAKGRGKGNHIKEPKSHLSKPKYKFHKLTYQSVDVNPNNDHWLDW